MRKREENNVEKKCGSTEMDTVFTLFISKASELQ